MGRKSTCTAAHALRTHPVALSDDLGGRRRIRVLRDVVQHLLNTPLLDLRIDLPWHGAYPPRLTMRRHQTWGASPSQRAEA